VQPPESATAMTPRREGKCREDFLPQMKGGCTQINFNTDCIFHLCSSDFHLWQICISPRLGGLAVYFVFIVG
jgi:hypothetical protein